MAVTHIVAFTWAQGTDDATVTGIDEALHAMVARGFEGLESWHGGRNLRINPDTADYGVAAVFAGRAAYERYRDDAEHQRIIAEMIKPHVAARTATQFED